jgi:hypothetical protein
MYAGAWYTVKGMGGYGGMIHDLRLRFHIFLLLTVPISVFLSNNSIQEGHSYM